MYDLIILTTAICRPELHNACLKSFADDLRNQGISVFWRVNVDPALGNQDETTDNFKKIIHDIDHIISFPSEPCFFTAANYLIQEAHEEELQDLNDNGYVMWLEDDKKHDISFNIQELIDSDYDYIGFHPNHLFEFSFHPSMWSKQFFSEHVYEPYVLNDGNKQDPEQLLIDYHCNKRKENEDHFKNVKRIHFNGVFDHIGREWNQENNVIKWNKNIKNANISYKSL